MGLLDGMLGNVLNGALGGGQAQGASPLLSIVASMLADRGPHGGLGGLIQQFQQAGLGEQIQSWIGTGQNLPISADHIVQVLGPRLGQIAQQLGVSHGEAADQLAQTLPQIIDHVTPNGEVPHGGVGGAEEVLAALGGLLRR